MIHRAIRFRVGWGTLTALCALGCGAASGGQSFDDGNDGLGNGRVRAVPELPQKALELASQPSVRIGPFAEGIDARLIGDLDGDGLSELALSVNVANDDAESSRVRIFYGRPDLARPFDLDQADFVLSDTWGGPSALGDVNGDGLADLGMSSYSAATRSFPLLLGSRERQSGELSSTSLRDVLFQGPDLPTVYAALLYPMAAGDVNRDGYDDVLIEGFDTAALVLGRAQIGALTLQTNSVALHASGNHRALTWWSAAGDLDGDGFADLLAAQQGADDQEVSTAKTSLFFGHAGNWGTANELVLPDVELHNGAWSAVGDWDSDGKSDLLRVAASPDVGVTGAPPAELQVELALAYGSAERFQGASLPGQPLALSGMWVRYVDLARGDLDGDGRGDLLLTSLEPNATGTELPRPQRTSALYFLPGAEHRRVDEVALSGLDPALQGVGGRVTSGGDFNGDGFQDLLLNETSGDSGANQVRLIFGGPRQ